MIEINLLPEEHRKKPMQRKYQREITPAEPLPVGMSGISKIALAALVAGALGIGTLIDALYNESWFRRNALSAIKIREMKMSVDAQTRFPYSFSPWEEYARLEESILRELEIPEAVVAPQTDRILRAGNNIADRVATRILRGRNTYDIKEVMKTVPRDWLMEAIANEIEREGIFYTEESLLSQAFDPKLHEEGKATLDCDLLAYLMCHVGRKLDIEMDAVPGAAHMYLTVETGDGEKVYVIEPTKFRKVIVGRNFIDREGSGIEDGFFSTSDKQRTHGGLVADPKYAERVGLHRPIEDEQFLRESMLSNIIAGLNKGVEEQGQKERLYEKAWQLAQDAVNYNLSKNVYIFCLEAGEEAAKNKETKKALIAFERAAWLRKTKELTTEPSELIGMGKLLYKTGEIEAASKVLAEARAFYEKHEDGPVIRGDGMRYAWNEEHAVLLTYSSIVEVRRGQVSIGTIYNDWAVPAFNQLDRKESTRALPEYRRLKELVEIVERKNRQK